MKAHKGWKQMAAVVMMVAASLLTAAAQTNQATPEPLLEEPFVENGTNNPAVNPLATNAPPARVVQPAQFQLPAELKELVRRTEAGTNEEALIEFVRYSPTRYPITVDQILYLRDLGISTRVLEALVQYHPLQIGGTNETAIAEGEVPSGMETNAANVAPQFETNVTGVIPGTAVDTNVFYSSLAPYGTWLDLPGYGWAWQPTIVAINPYWQPYCNDGRWFWSDCGWYWHSYYSWGWAPFHYGRWWRYPRYGWVWCPDRVWGPAWVTWRDSGRYCGWAPLPPQARFQHGIGWTQGGKPVGRHHNFGLPASDFTFVPLNRFADHSLTAHRLSAQELQTVFNRATANNNLAIANQRVINHGIDPQRVAAAINRPLQPIPVSSLQHTPAASRMTGRAPAASLQTAPSRWTVPTPSGQLPPTGLSFGPNRRYGDESRPTLGIRVPNQVPTVHGRATTIPNRTTPVLPAQPQAIRPTTPLANPGANLSRSLPQRNWAVPQAQLQPNPGRAVPRSSFAVPPPTAPVPTLRPPTVGRAPVLPPSSTFRTPAFQPAPFGRSIAPPSVTAPVGRPPVLAPSPAFRAPAFQAPPAMPPGGRAGGGRR